MSNAMVTTKQRVDDADNDDFSNQHRSHQGSEQHRFPEIVHVMVTEADDSIIQWIEGGEAFVVKDMRNIGSVLQLYFQHNNYSSFQRQLNMYGWKKWTSGKYKGAFHHPQFHQNRGTPSDLLHIVRKAPPTERAKKRPRKLQSAPNQEENDAAKGRPYKRRLTTSTASNQNHSNSTIPIIHGTTAPYSNESRIGFSSRPSISGGRQVNNPLKARSDTRYGQYSHNLNLPQTNVNPTRHNIGGGRIHLLAAAAAFLYEVENRSNFPIP